LELCRIRVAGQVSLPVYLGGSAMTSALGAEKDHVTQAIEITINIALLALLSAICYQILRPFLPLIAWGIILAVAAYPVHCRLKRTLRGRGGLAATIFTVILLATVLIPAIMLAGTLVEGSQRLSSRVAREGVSIPALPPKLARMPLIGAPITRVWNMASNNLAALLSHFTPQIKAAIAALLSAAAGFGSALLQLILSIVVAGFLLANAEGGASLTRSLANRLLGEKGPEFEKLASSTIRSVTTGIIGVACIQTVFATLGFLLAGLPGAALWASLFLFAAILQVGVLVLVPAVIYVFAVATTTKAIIFLVWSIVVGLMDNVLKPLLLGRGVAVPVAVVFLGAIGGFVSMGIIGLFVGAIVLAVGYKLLLAWLGETRNQGET
jgi:predicted PurR-regulated permease PerM